MGARVFEYQFLVERSFVGGTFPIEMTNLDLPGQAVTVGCWLASAGAQVVKGDRLLELLAGDVVVDIPAPATGRLSETRVAEDDVVSPGQVLGIIEIPDE